MSIDSCYEMTKTAGEDMIRELEVGGGRDGNGLTPIVPSAAAE